MRRKLIITVGALLFACTPVWGVPFGTFGGTVTGNDSVTGVDGLHGWALDSSGIAYVDIYVDGVIDGRANYGRERTGVIPTGYPDSAAAGYGYQFNSTRYLNGLVLVSAKATAADGSSAWIGSEWLEIVNASHLLKPFGDLTHPNRHAELRGACNIADPFRRYTVVEGWALDAGVELGHGDDPPGDAGVSTVELLIDGSLFYNTDLDCRFDPARGGYSQCYGLYSPGLERNFRFLPDAPHGRFRFVLDVGVLVALGYFEGSHVISVRAHDHAGNHATIDEDVVFFRCDENNGNEASFGYQRWATGGLMQNGTIEILGWVLDWEGVASVNVLVDGVQVGIANYGEPRPLISSRYPGYPDTVPPAPGPGFSYLLDSTMLSDGPHDIMIEGVDVLGDRTRIGERTLVVNNDAP